MIADHQRRWYGIDLDPETEIVVTADATEALAGALLGMLDAGDEVIVFEPAVRQLSGGHREGRGTGCSPNVGSSSP